MLTVATSNGIQLLQGQGNELEGHDVGALVADGGSWLALVDGRSVWRRSPGGVWKEIGASAGQDLTCIVALPVGPLLGTKGAHLLQMSGAGQMKAVGAFESAPSRDEWYTPWGGPPDVRSIAVAGDGALYVNVHVGGVLRSGDGGSSWSATIDMNADVHQVLCPRPLQPELVLVACADGMAMSRDSGASWRLRDHGLRGSYCRALAVVGDTVIVCASDGPGGGHVGLYRAPLDDGWSDFERCGQGLPALSDNVETGWLAGNGEVVALVVPDGAVFTSADGGASWEQIGECGGHQRSLAWV